MGGRLAAGNVIVGRVGVVIAGRVSHHLVPATASNARRIPVTFLQPAICAAVAGAGDDDPAAREFKDMAALDLLIDALLAVKNEQEVSSCVLSAWLSDCHERTRYY
jgi:hypothetical protein